METHYFYFFSRWSLHTQKKECSNLIFAHPHLLLIIIIITTRGVYG